MLSLKNHNESEPYRELSEERGRVTSDENTRKKWLPAHGGAISTVLPLYISNLLEARPKKFLSKPYMTTYHEI